MKKNLKLFGFLFSILIIFGVTGCNKKNIDEPVIPAKPKEEVLSITNDPKELDLYKDFITTATYTYDLEENVYNSLEAKIKDDGSITVVFKSENEEDSDVTRQITLKERPKGLAITYDYKTGIGYVYVLSVTHNVYLAELTRTSDIKLVRYDVDNVEGFFSMNGDIEGKKNYQPLVLIKTTDNKFYTDYKFTTDTQKVLREVIEPIKKTN